LLACLLQSFFLTSHHVLAKKSLSHSEKANEYAQNANKFADKANEISIGQTETALREQIALARQRMEDVGFKLQEVLKGRKKEQLSQEEQNHLSFLEISWNSSVEGYMNAYEDACGKFIDNKTDPSRFKKCILRK